ncbi:hypothetical protein ACHAQA_003543 [Verticillium albo-atrum]
MAAADANTASPEMPPLPLDTDQAPSDISITITHRTIPYTFAFDPSATITDLSDAIAEQMSIPPTNQKFLIPKHGLQKHPFAKPLPLISLQSAKIQLLAPPPDELAALQHASRLAQTMKDIGPFKTLNGRRPTGRNGAHRHNARTARTVSDSTQHTFLTVRPLPFLPHPEQSLSLLNRLKNDRGIRATMAKHKFTVHLLTEMEPLSNTSATHEGTTRLLGLNRNKGEVIELRLRTDAHDGYRDYKTIRRTLCHELAHNVHSDHDKDFWALCRQIEREVEAANVGRTTGGSDGFYAPARPGGEDEDEDMVDDHGGWQGGEFVLGGGSASGQGQGQGLSRREILAKAAEERAKNMNMDRPDGGRPDPGASS